MQGISAHIQQSSMLNNDATHGKPHKYMTLSKDLGRFVKAMYRKLGLFWHLHLNLVK